MASFGDFNRVNTNVTALGAQLSLNKINSELGDSRLKLSTGKRINSAEDDSAGYAIATKLNSRVKGLEQALQNVSDAKSMLDVVEGAYNSIMDNLIEMKALAIQGANATMKAGSNEMAYIAKQLEALGNEINKIAESTSFNNIELVDSTISLDLQVGEETSDTFSISLAEINLGTLFHTAGVNKDIGANEPLGDKTVNGGIASAFVTGNSTDNHLFQAIDANQIDDGAADNISAGGSSGQNGSTILVRELASAGSVEQDQLLIDDVNVNSFDMRAFSSHIDSAIDSMNSSLNSLGINQRTLSGNETNLLKAITANSAAHSRIMDTDFAKEQSNSIRLQILQQTATAALSQANMGPQAVLGFLGSNFHSFIHLLRE